MNPSSPLKSQRFAPRSLARPLAAASLAAALALSLAACSSAPERPAPTPLAPLVALQPATQVWNTAIGAVDPLLTPAVHGQTLLLANAAGAVLALDGANGQVRWRVELAQPLSAAAGFDGQTAAVVTQDNELLALNSAGVQWRARLPARVLTAPLVAGQRVFVLANDRSVHAFDARNGAPLWQHRGRTAEALVLQQSGVLLPVGDTLVVGLGGRLVGFDPLNGRIRWDAAIATPRGVNEIERLVDLVGRTGRVGDQLCVRAFQAAVGCVDGASGRLVWTQPADGAVGLSADAERVYGVERNGRVLAWRRDAGARAWSSDALLHRGLTAPLAAGRSIAVGDAQGFVHLLSRDDGTLLNRLSTDGSAIVAGPLLLGNTLVAVTRNGGVYAWRPQ
ncbi:MAG: outer membrane protein assembly factor BamB [Betaproteobacteria bacterium]|uniref:outer membrane protein assembly factor BamB n=1 Tax=Serpentinimonas maccroryi TaxID=1458426 RepID=UPI001E518719|nr:outer membrane protein assembly factor BamB [Serpentinimonas maccroryi]MCL5968329.1 outer membrane protein assembly factor BamB [Betaproteobacteria bacterium]